MQNVDIFKWQKQGISVRYPGGKGAGPAVVLALLGFALLGATVYMVGQDRDKMAKNPVAGIEEWEGPSPARSASRRNNTRSSYGDDAENVSPNALFGQPIFIYKDQCERCNRELRHAY